MAEKDIAKIIGMRIKEERKKKKMTQKDLGDAVGVKHNTISTYESGKNAPERNIIFKIARALDIKVDDLFPSDTDESKENFSKALTLADGLDVKDMQFLNELIQKALSYKGEDREKFLESIKFTVDYHENQNKN